MPPQGILSKNGCATMAAHARRPRLQILGLHHGQPHRYALCRNNWVLRQAHSQHKSGSIDGFTKKYGVDRLLYYEVFSDVGKAKRRELQLKGWRREKKIKLIEKLNPRWEDLAEHWGQEMLFGGESLKKTT